jgi:hypothetical protein
VCSACSGDYENPDVMEPEPIEEIEDRMQSALEAAYALFGVTTVGQIQEPSK